MYKVFLDRQLGQGFELYGEYATEAEAVSKATACGTSRVCPRYVLTPLGQELNPFNQVVQHAAYFGR